MQARRAVLAFAIALMVTAVIASLAPPPQSGKRGESAPAPPAPPAAGLPVKPLTVDVDAGAPRPVERPVPRGRRFVLTVRAAEPGDVEVTGLGLNAPADATAPALFDILTDEAGRYEVRFTALGARPKRVATLVVDERDEPAR